MSCEGFEEYLEAVYQLQEIGREATTSALSDWLGVTMASVSGMIRRLGENGLVNYERYKPVTLTKEGRLQALTTLRRHRLWEVFLHDRLGVPWYAVFDEACRLEHSTSREVETALDRYLGFPRFCPHGFPVPTADGRVDSVKPTPLVEWEEERSARVIRIGERETDLLKYLSDNGIRPGSEVVVLKKAPFDGPVTIKVIEGEQFSLSNAIASITMVEDAQGRR